MAKDLFSHSLWDVKSLSELSVKMVCFSFRPKDAIRALKKRLNGNKNYREVMLALTVSGGRLECLKGQNPFVIFLFLALSWMYTLFPLTATALPFSSLQLPPHFLGESCWKLCIAAFWLNWFLLLFVALTHPKYWLRKVNVIQMGLLLLEVFLSTLISLCPTIPPLQGNSCGHICKWGWWTCHIFSFISSWCTISLVNESL